MGKWLFFKQSGLDAGRAALLPILLDLYFMILNGIFKFGMPYEMSSLNLFLLMYADNMVFFSESEESLQILLNELLRYCNKWKMCVNVEKSNIVIFKKQW